MRRRRRAQVATGLVIGGVAAGAIALVAVALALGTGVGPGGSRVAGADESGPYYLAIGGSESVGVQPDAADPRGAPSDEGYADDLTRSETSRWPGLQLVELGCPGETASAALDGGGACHYDAGSQVGEALAFLSRAHPGSTVLATVDLGFNDLRPCLGQADGERALVTAALAEVGQTVTTIVDEDKKSAGGPSLDVVGLEKYDPYLGTAYTAGPAGETFAEATLPVFDEREYHPRQRLPRRRRIGGRRARRVRHRQQQPTTLAGYGTVPTDVARVCALTWAYADSPFPHNVHPNAVGYQVVAGRRSPPRSTGPADRADRPDRVPLDRIPRDWRRADAGGTAGPIAARPARPVDQDRSGRTVAASAPDDRRGGPPCRATSPGTGQSSSPTTTTSRSPARPR